MDVILDVAGAIARILLFLWLAWRLLKHVVSVAIGADPPPEPPKPGGPGFEVILKPSDHAQDKKDTPPG